MKFGDTQSDKILINQIQNLLYAPGAGDTPSACQDNLTKANNLFQQLTSEDSRKSAQYFIDDFTQRCKPSSLTILKNPVILAIAGLVLLLILLKR